MVTETYQTYSNFLADQARRFEAIANLGSETKFPSFTRHPALRLKKGSHVVAYTFGGELNDRAGSITGNFCSYMPLAFSEEGFHSSILECGAVSGGIDPTSPTSLEKLRQLAAPVETVFEAFTSPERLTLLCNGLIYDRSTLVARAVPNESLYALTRTIQDSCQGLPEETTIKNAWGQHVVLGHVTKNQRNVAPFTVPHVMPLGAITPESIVVGTLNFTDEGPNFTVFRKFPL